MNITVVQGVRDTAVLGTETRRVRDVSPALMQLEPNEGPLTTLLARLRSRTATDPKLEWFEDQLLPDFDTLGAAVAVGDTTLTVGNYKLYRQDDLVRINDNEIVRVTANPTSSPISVKRGVGSVGATAAPNGGRLFILSDAAMEFATYRNQLTTQKVPKYNYTQILKSPASFSGTALGTKTFAGDDKMQERNKMLIEHKKKMEKALLLGTPFEDLSGADPQRSTAGCAYYISTNVKDFSGGFTEPEFEDFIRLPFRYGAREKVVLCSPKAIQSINSFQRSKLQTFSDQSSYGVTMTEYKNAGRKLMLIEEMLLTNQNLNDLTGIAGWMIVLDLADLELRFLKGRATELWENVQNPGVDGEIDEYRCEFGLEMHLDQKHALGTGVQD